MPHAPSCERWHGRCQMPLLNRFVYAARSVYGPTLKKSWYLQWWVLVITGCTFIYCAFHPISQYHLSRRATAFRATLLMRLSVTWVDGESVVGPLMPSTNHHDTLWIYAPQDFYHGFLAPIEREHRKWVMTFKALSGRREDTARTMLAKVEEYLATLPQTAEHVAARAVVHEVRTSPDSHFRGPYFQRSDRFVSPLGCLQLAALFASFAVLCVAGFQSVARWTKRLRARLSPKPGHCQFCRYDLAGTSGTRCPECGKEPG